MKLLDIKSGNAEVVISGTVISFDNNPITLTYGSTANPLQLTFEFIDEEGKTEPRMEGNKATDRHLVIRLFNFKNPLGTGSVTPISIGTLDNRRLYLHFRAYQLTGSKARTVEYTLYKGEEVTVHG